MSVGETAFIICSRTDSVRIPNKPFKIINGKPLIEHLIDRLVKTELPVYVAVPVSQGAQYSYLEDKYKECKFKLYFGDAENPLLRMHQAATHFNVKNIIRVTHDKVFIEPDLVYKAIGLFNEKASDYVYSSEFTGGSAFEIISFKALEKAVETYARDIEHISYAIKSITDNKHHFSVPSKFRSELRFLVDYEDDALLLELLFQHAGNDINLIDAIAFVNKHVWAANINKLPLVTVYTCIHNDEKTIKKCMDSVIDQQTYTHGKVEYILIDDFSKDNSPIIAIRHAQRNNNVRFIRNPKNLGLASSSNIALKEAKGKYVLRLDADDFFYSTYSIGYLLSEIEDTRKDIIYPNNYFGSIHRVQQGKEEHHIGGALFNKAAINHIKFTDGLRGYEGLDFFVRAKEQLNIGYLNRPTFFYTQRPGSMSKTNLENRKKLKESILNQHVPNS